MNVQTLIGLKATALILTLAGGGALAFAASASDVTLGAAARPAHASQVLPAALRPVFYQALAKDAGGAYPINEKGCATLSDQKLKACFDASGAHFSGAGSPLTLHLTAYGRGDKLIAVETVKPVIAGNQVSYGHDNLSEWWRVQPVGFEQGFTIEKRPGGHGDLTLALAANGNAKQASSLIRHSGENRNPVKSITDWMQVAAGMTGKGVHQNPHENTLGWGRLRYGDLVVTDANGKVIPAILTNKDDRILIAVNDTHAAYPLTVDPLVWLEQEVTPNDGPAYSFGWSVAVAGSTALVGTPEQDAAYVFTNSDGTWTQTAKLTPSDGTGADGFGGSVAIAGSTALVGAPHATVNGNPGQGAAYVFSEAGGSWSQSQKLTASDGGGGDGFGGSVALDDMTALIGADDADVNGNEHQGAVYVFTETGVTWSQQQKLTAADGMAHDDFGDSVALDDMTALIGADGATVNGDTFQGAAYVFTESDGTWAQTAKLTASDGAGADGFGGSLALAGSTAVVGAPNATVNGNSGQGAAYVFSEAGGSWSQSQKLIASITWGADSFGVSVALAGSTILIGADYFTPDEWDYGQGAAYVFRESGGSWSQIKRLLASDGGYIQHFGHSVALAGTTALVGENAFGVQGAAYFYSPSNLGLAVSAPQTVDQGQQYSSQMIATNNSSAASPAVTAWVAVPPAASFVSATASQGHCNAYSTVVRCAFGAINGNAGTATANVTLKAVGSPGTAIKNKAKIVKATPTLTASAATEITEGSFCPEGYREHDGSLAPGERTYSPIYRAPAGEENAILKAPAGFRLFGVFQNASHGRKVHRAPGNELHRWAPAGRFMWAVKAGSSGGTYTLCIMHP